MHSKRLMFGYKRLMFIATLKNLIATLARGQSTFTCSKSIIETPEQ